MLSEYKNTFSLRDEIGTCPNIEVKIDIMDKTAFFIRPYHVKEEDKNTLNKEIMLFGYFKGRFFCIFQPSNIDKEESNGRQKSCNWL